MSDLTDMRPVTLPLSSKDVFSFLVPGATLIILIYLFEYWSKLFLPADNTFSTPIKTALSSMAEPTNWAYSALFLVAVTASAYVVGHLVSWISVLALDRALVAKGHGYPYEHLLKIRNEKKMPPILISRSYSYRALFFWLNFYLVMRYFALFKPGTALAHASRWLGWFCAGLIVFKFIVSPIVAHSSREAMVKVWKILYIPYDLCTGLLSRFTRSTEPFSGRFRRAYHYYFVREFGMTPQQAETGNHWWPIMFLKERAPRLEVLVNYWYNLYSLSRNLSAALYLGFAYCFVSVAIQIGQLDGIANAHSRLMMQCIPLVYLFGALLFLSRFYYLFAQRHTRLLLRAFVFNCGGLRIPEGSTQPPESRQVPPET